MSRFTIYFQIGEAGEGRSEMYLGFFTLFLTIFWSSTAFADKIYWPAKEECGILCSKPSKRYWAYPGKSEALIAGELANPSRETAYGASGVYFPPNTKFAAFTFLEKPGEKNKILALSDIGVWAFIERGSITYLDSLEGFDEIFSDLDIIVSLRSGNVFREVIRTCSAGKTVTVGAKLNVKANIPLSIVDIEISSEVSGSIKSDYPKGYNIRIHRFYSTKSRVKIDIQAYEECGANDLEPLDFRFDIFIDDSVKKLRPETFENAKFPLVEGKPIIRCLEQYNSYAEYLKNVQNIPKDLIPVVAAMTASWVNFEEYYKCS